MIFFLKKFKKEYLSDKSWKTKTANNLKVGQATILLGVNKETNSYKVYVLFKTDNTYFYYLCTGMDTNEAEKVKKEAEHLYKKVCNIV